MDIFRLQKETRKIQVAQKVTERVLPDLDLAVQETCSRSPKGGCPPSIKVLPRKIKMEHPEKGKVS